MSRTAAKREIDMDDFKSSMRDRVWDSDQAAALIDEAPGAYKPIDEVMENQTDLVQIVHRLRAIVNLKGTK